MKKKTLTKFLIIYIVFIEISIFCFLSSSYAMDIPLSKQTQSRLDLIEDYLYCQENSSDLLYTHQSKIDNLKAISNTDAGLNTTRLIILIKLFMILHI